MLLESLLVFVRQVPINSRAWHRVDRPLPALLEQARTPGRTGPSNAFCHHPDQANWLFPHWNAPFVKMIAVAACDSLPQHSGKQVATGADWSPKSGQVLTLSEPGQPCENTRDPIGKTHAPSSPMHARLRGLCKPSQRT
jgi:hypothetical protein